MVGHLFFAEIFFLENVSKIFPMIFCNDFFSKISEIFPMIFPMKNFVGKKIDDFLNENSK